MPDVTVVAEGEEPEPVAAPGPRSPLQLLLGKRAELEANLYLDLAVPRWGEVLGRRLWVRYRPGKPSVFTQSMTRREEAHKADLAKGGKGDPDWLAKANADLLVSACVAVYDLELDEKPPHGPLPSGDYPTFGSQELSEAVGAPKNAVATVLKVYGTDADVLLAATQLLNWSGQASKEAGDDFLSS